jgi:hypothetical protein
MALVRIGVNLGERGLLPPSGAVSKEHFKALEKLQGLIGVVEKKDEGDSISRPVSCAPSTEDRNDVELQLLPSRDEMQTSAADYGDIESQSLPSEEETQRSPDDHIPDIQFALGASGIISFNIVQRPSARAMYRKTREELQGQRARSSSELNLQAIEPSAASAGP